MPKGKIVTKIDLNDIITSKMSKIKSLDFLKKKTVKEIADITCDVIKERSRDGYGCDAEGNSVKFQGYAPDYKKIRIKKGLQVEHVDLTVTGKFLDQLRHIDTQENKNFKIGFHESDRGKARGAQEGIRLKDGNMVVRPVLGLTSKDKNKLWQQIKPLIQQDLDDYYNK